MIPFSEWAPDSPDLSDKAREVSGVIPERDGYRPFKALATTSTALTAQAQGAVWFRAADGTTYSFAGDETKLYILENSTTWTDVSRLVGGAYNTGATDFWRFAQFGTTAYATNGTDALQSFDLSAGTRWADASGSPPVGRFIGAVRNFLVLANLADEPQTVAWSGANNPGTWASSATTLADEQALADGGAITGFVGGEFGVVLQEAGVTRMSFEGAPTVFRFDKVSNEVGCTLSGTVAAWSNLVFFYHTSGFHMCINGQEIRPIGRGRVDRWFATEIELLNAFRVTAAVDPVNGLYCVSFPSTEAGTPDQILVYNWFADRWTHAAVTCEMIYSGAAQQSWELEDLDVFGTLELVPYSLDSSYWLGSRSLFLAGFYTDHKSGAFNGSNLAAQIDTQEFQPMEGRLARIRGIRPMVDGGTPSIALGTRKTQQAAVSWSAARAINAYGNCVFNNAGRYARARVTMPAASSFTYMQGIDDVDARPMGVR